MPTALSRPPRPRAKLAQLAGFGLHSIEQPIAAGQWAALAALCRSSPLPIALDEELIGVADPARQAALLDEIAPAYIVLKPTLLGGHAATRALDCPGRGPRHRLVDDFGPGIERGPERRGPAHGRVRGAAAFAQGLGTGQLYHNNVAAPLHVAGGTLRYDPTGAWEMPA